MGATRGVSASRSSRRSSDAAQATREEQVDALEAIEAARQIDWLEESAGERLGRYETEDGAPARNA